MSFKIPLREQTVELCLNCLDFEFERLPVLTYYKGMTLDTEETLSGWFPTGNTTCIDPDKPPYLVKGIHQLVADSGKPNVRLLSLLYSQAQSGGFTEVLGDHCVGFTIVDWGKLTNMINVDGFRNRWMVWDGQVPDEIELVRSLHRRQFTRN